MKKVIDAENEKVIETFNEKNIDKVLTRYENDGRWNDVGVDHDGDIILWED